MAAVFRYKAKSHPTDNFLSPVLVETFQRSGFTAAELESTIGVSKWTIYKSLGKSRNTVPSTMLMIDMLYAFEAKKPGSIKFFGLRMAGRSAIAAENLIARELDSAIDDESQSKVEKDPTKLAKELAEVDPNLIVEQLDRNTALNIVSGLFKNKPEFTSIFSRHVDLETAVEICYSFINNVSNFLAGLVRKLDFEQGFKVFKLLLRKEKLISFIGKQNINPGYPKTLVRLGIKLGANLEEVGTQLEPPAMAAIMRGYSPNIVDPSDMVSLNTDCKALEQNYQLRQGRQSKPTKKSKPTQK